MALVAKTQVLQVRLDAELLNLFMQAAEARHMTVSACVRELMRQHAKSYQDHLKRLEHEERKQAARDVVAVQAAPVPSEPVKAPVAPSGKPEGPVARRMRLKKDAKLRRQDVYEDDDE